MINHKHEFVYIHIPKCGGTSISALKDSTLPNPRAGDHLAYERYIKAFPETINYKFFATVRNPWDKLVSTYFYWKLMTKDHPHYYWNEHIVKHIQSKDLTFRGLILALNHQRLKRHFYDKWFYENGYGKLLNVLLHDQLSFLKPDPEDMNFIGRFENLQEDFNTICDKIGMPRQELPHKNKSKHKHYTEYYDDETSQIVAEKYREDIEYFGYKFGE